MNQLEPARLDIDRAISGHGTKGVENDPKAQLMAQSAPDSRSRVRTAEGRHRVDDLLDALRKYAGRHVVVIRGYPDPDSLASAWAHSCLAASIGIECDIAHLPLVSRAENRAMVNMLDLPLVRVTAPEDLDRYNALSLVDTNSIELPRSTGLPCVSIVDHHALLTNSTADFMDIRLAVGAASTIYTEYILDAPTRVLDNSSIATRLATALAYGIRSDTDDLLHATSDDLHALANIINLVDADVLASLSHYGIPASSMRIMRRALESMHVDGTWVYAGVGQVRSQDRDAIGQAADFLVRREGIRTAITFGLVDGWIDGSLRTTDPSLDPAMWLRDAFGIGPLGMPYGGGRRGKGGFQIPLGPLATCPNQDGLWQVVKDMVEDTIRKRIGMSDDSS